MGKFLKEILIMSNNIFEESEGFDDEDELDIEDMEDKKDIEDIGEEPHTDEQEEIDPNRVGVIRRVVGARLIYKRLENDGTYSELWMYNTTPNNDEINIRKNILLDTNIDPKTFLSQTQESKEQCFIWSKGDVQFLEVQGLTR